MPLMVGLRAAAAILAAVSIGVQSQQARPHSTHNPKHGGLFFRAAGDTLHIEGLWPQQRLFKLYIYDESSQPLPPDRMHTIEGRVEAAGETAPLMLLADGSAFLARVPPLKTPAEILLVLKLSPNVEPEGFYFIFGGHSDEQALSFEIEPAIIPPTLTGILQALRDDVREAGRLVEERQGGFAFGPGFHGRDHALALEQYRPQLAAAVRPRADAAIRAVVRAAWLLHTAADEGTNEQVRGAIAAFGAGVADIEAAFRGVVR